MKERRQTRDGVRQGQSEKIVAALTRCREARAWIRFVDQFGFLRRFQTSVWRGPALKLDMRKHVRRKYFCHRGRRLEEGQLGNLDVLLLRQQFCAALIEPALHIPERDLFV